MRQSKRDHRTDDRGAVAIIVALSMVLLCVVAAMVIDLGLVRVDRQSNKSAADAAAIAGTQGLITDDSVAEFHPFAGVCQALHYLQANSDAFASFSPAPTWADGNDDPIATDGCASSMASAVCTPDEPGTWARVEATSADKSLHVVIQSGYDVKVPSAADPSEPAFSEENLPALKTDAGDSTFGGCDQLAVVISKTRHTTLGTFASDSMGSTIRSVGRVVVGPPEDPVALLLLERYDCQVLTVNGTGAETVGPFVHVLSSVDATTGNEAPGRIHVDSNATGDNCNKPVISTGTNHVKAVYAQKTSTGPGVIEVVAQDQATALAAAADAAPNVLAEDGAVTHGELLTRSRVDDVYLDGVRQALDLSSPPWATPFTPGASDALVTNCKTAGAEVAAAQAVTGTVFFDCPTSGPGAGHLGYGTNLTFQAQKVIVNGSIDMANGLLAFPQATEIYVKGDGATGISVKGTFAVRTDGASGCQTSVASTGKAKIVVGSGSLSMNDAGSKLELCDTTMFMAGGYSDGCVPATSGTYFDDPAQVCHGSGTGNGYMNLAGGNVDWTAPNMYFHEKVPADELDQAYVDYSEDLAFWSESAGADLLRNSSGNVSKLTGVFMMPNADQLDLGGNGNQYVKNSQYIVRKLNVHGSSSKLEMQPDPNDVVPNPTFTFDLVR